MTKGRDLPSYIVRNGRGVLYYVRRGESWIRLETQFPEGQAVPFALHQERERLMAAPTPVAPGQDLAAVIRHYCASDKYRSKAARTQRDYDQRIEYIAAKIGHLRPANIERRHVLGWLEAWSRKDGPHAANYRLRVLRIILEHAIDMGLLKSGQNPAKGVSEVKYDKAERGPWPVDKVHAFRDAYAAGTLERLIFELCIGTGQRISDVLKMQWTDMDGTAIRVRQNKTKKRLWIPTTTELHRALDAAPRWSLFIVPGENEAVQRSYRSAAWHMLAARKSIGAEAHDLHSLRYTAAAELCLAGCTDEEIAAVTGQSIAMVRHYTAAVRQKVRAIKAQRTRE